MPAVVCSRRLATASNRSRKQRGCLAPRRSSPWQLDAGISGYGAASPDAGAAAIVGLISELKSELSGQDPRNVEYCWDKIRRDNVFSRAQAGAFLIALTGLEMALWEVAPKAAGQPLYRMFGGKFGDRIRLYADYGDGDEETGSPQDVRRAPHDGRGLTAKFRHRRFASSGKVRRGKPHHQRRGTALHGGTRGGGARGDRP
ncbi:hypothetical protein [Mesorhizobium sp. LjNodule214]|uniref:hypothetical protein n=1 Tax=Mesorhizobium sp. LjNodule214 TaxID=3342252 RepID=UPI003ECEF045